MSEIHKYPDRGVGGWQEFERELPGYLLRSGATAEETAIAMEAARKAYLDNRAVTGKELTPPEGVPATAENIEALLRRLVDWTYELHHRLLIDLACTHVLLARERAELARLRGQRVAPPEGAGQVLEFHRTT